MWDGVFLVVGLTPVLRVLLPPLLGCLVVLQVNWILFLPTPQRQEVTSTYCIGACKWQCPLATRLACCRTKTDRLTSGDTDTHLQYRGQNQQAWHADTTPVKGNDSVEKICDRGKAWCRSQRESIFEHTPNLSSGAVTCIFAAASSTAAAVPSTGTSAR